MKKFAVILSGCGAKDGSEISEVTFSLLSLRLNEAEYEVFAPDLDFISKSHLSSDPDLKFDNQKRNSLEEAARIVRGKIKKLEFLEIEKFDGLLIPGGFGVKEVLSKISFVDEIIKRAHSFKKPIIAICLAPSLISKNIENSKITYGPDSSFRSGNELNSTQIIHSNSDEFITDEKNKLYTTPAFMSGPETDLALVFKGIHGAISEAIKTL